MKVHKEKALLFLVFLLMPIVVDGLELQQKEARLNMGFYFNSISEVANRTDIETSLNFWAQELFALEAKKHDFLIASSKAFIFERIEDMQESFDQGEIDLIIAPPLLISKYFKREKLSDGFVGVLEENKPEKLLLIARTDKNIHGVDDLPGKRLGLIDNDELADIFLDTLAFKELKKGYNDIGLTIQRQKKNNRIILDVFFNKTDAGVAYNSSYETMVELNPEIKNKITILEEFPVKGRNFSYFRHDYPISNLLIEVAVNFSSNPRAKQILDLFKTPEVAYCKVSELDSYDNLYKDYLFLKKHAGK